MKRSMAVAREEPRADMTPLIDVVFQILIFFLCTLHFRQLEGRLDVFLPRELGGHAGRAGRAPIDPLELRIRVLAAGERREPRSPERAWSGSGPYDLVGRRLAYTVGPRRVDDLEALGACLAELRARDPSYRLCLEAGAGTLQGDVLAVFDRALDAGFADFLERGAG